MELWDDELSELELRKRYARFHKVAFDIIPESEWPSFLRQLLPYERNFAYS